MTPENYAKRRYQQIIFNDYFPNNGCSWRSNEQYVYQDVIYNINNTVSEWLKEPTNIVILQFKGTHIFNRYYDCSDNPFKDYNLFTDLNIHDYCKLYGNKDVYDRLRFHGLSTYETAIFQRFIKDGWSRSTDFGMFLGTEAVQPLYSWSGK